MDVSPSRVRNAENKRGGLRLQKISPELGGTAY